MKPSENKRFNILHVITRLPVGGVENMLLKVIKGYDSKRFNTTVCCLKEGGDIAEELRRSGYNVKILNRMQKRGFDFGAITALYRLLKKEDIHILRTHQYHANLYGRIAGVLAGVPVIVPSFHSRYESPLKPKLHRRYLNSLLSLFSDTLVAVSPAVLSDITRYDWVNSGKIKVIFNGVKIDDFNLEISKYESRKKLNMPVNNYIIGTVGRIKEEKGHKFFIEAASKLNNVCVAIAGDGPLINELKDVSNSSGVRCIFMGMMAPEKIPLFLRSLDIFCFPSLWEGFPSALIEAIAAGLPVVASDIPSNREVLGDNGMLVPPADYVRLGEALKLLIDTTSMIDSLGKKARERAKMFSIENTVKGYQDIFEEILREKGYYDEV